jgi:hypothetical protein
MKTANKLGTEEIPNHRHNHHLYDLMKTANKLGTKEIPNHRHNHHLTVGFYENCEQTEHRRNSKSSP